ncbi:MAG: hypothetical protein JWM82_3909, partial [Myxococcales bacterium]|nr:hypothetical protein [Myxococcales bacterium]
MTKRGPRKPAGDFSELERAFFEAAPPEVPVAVAEPLRFDDLDEPADGRWRPERRRRARGVTRRRGGRDEGRAPSPVAGRVGNAWHLVLAATARAWRLSRAATARWSRAAWSYGRAWSRPRAERARQRLVAGLVLAWTSLSRRVRASLARLADELPGERLQGKTLAATVGVAVFVLIAAGVVAQRPALSAP